MNGGYIPICPQMYKSNDETETMRKYAEAHGCGEFQMPKMTDEELKRWRDCIDSEQDIRMEPDSPVRPLPCVRDEHGAIKEQTVKRLLAKINEELDELKAALFFSSELSIERIAIQGEDELRIPDKETIAEEAADTITAITTMLEALGIDAEMRDEAQRRVNEKNRRRGRL